MELVQLLRQVIQMSSPKILTDKTDRHLQEQTLLSKEPGEAFIKKLY